jgi:VWFA-related protein
VRALAGGALALVLALLPAIPAAAQGDAGEEGGTFGERIEVELVGVEVWVSDRDGTPVQGLDAGDFTVLHDGRPVEVSHFSEVRSGTLVAPGAGTAEGASPNPIPAGPPAPETGAPGHLVLYFDQDRLEPGGYRSVLEGVRTILADAAVPADRILVLRQDTNLHLEAPFGSSAAQVSEALERVSSGAHRGLAAASELQQARDAILRAWEESQSLSELTGEALDAAAAGQAQAGAGGGVGPRGAVGGAGTGGGIGPSACDVFRQRIQPVLDAWVRNQSQRAAVSLANLEGTAGFLAGLPGVKTLLYVSDGLSVEPGAALAAYVADFCPGYGRDQEMLALSESLSRELDRLADHFNAHRVTIHSIGGSGLRAGGAGQASERGSRAPVGGGLRFESRQREADRGGMTRLAVATGGRPIFERNDLTADLAAIARDMESYYSLAYTPPAAEGNERRSAGIEVRVADPALRVRHRRGFRAPDPEETMDERLAGALHLGIVDNPLDLRLGVGAAPAPGEPLRLYVMVPVDRLLFTSGPPPEARVEVRVLARSADAAEPVEARQEYRLRRPEGAVDGPVQLPVALRLGPGPHRLAVGFRDLGSGETAVVTTDVTMDG